MATETGAKFQMLACISATMQCTASEGKWSSKVFVPVSLSPGSNSGKKKKKPKTINSLAQVIFTSIICRKYGQRWNKKNETVPSVADSLLRSQMTCSITALKHRSPALCQSVIVNALAALLHSVEENILRAKDVQFSYGISWIIAALWPVHFSSTRYGQYCIKPVTVTGCLGQFSIINLVKNDCSLIENSLRAFSPSECSCWKTCPFNSTNKLLDTGPAIQSLFPGTV